eukprot:TRINITY_DN47014_c0_g1_i1.p1 TRINITY_DN47014_c0_g1~~TRINITY_DN47014_c0_g1_i1.p1  ORF type:complete len:428 (-),score=23.18 TRINITY_DN47014_c0_g1_i1:91-1374(-)
MAADLPTARKLKLYATLALTVFFHLLDFIKDIILMAEYFQKEWYGWFSVIAVFVGTPAVVIFWGYWRRRQRRMAFLSILELNVIVHAWETFQDGAMSPTLIQVKEYEVLFEALPQFLFGIYTLVALELEGVSKPSVSQRLGPLLNCGSIAHTLASRTVRLHPRCSGCLCHLYFALDLLLNPMTFHLVFVAGSCHAASHTQLRKPCNNFFLFVLPVATYLVAVLILHIGLRVRDCLLASQVSLVYHLLSPVVALRDDIPFAVRSALLSLRQHSLCILWTCAGLYWLFQLVATRRTQDVFVNDVLEAADGLLLVSPVWMYALGRQIRSWNGGVLSLVACLCGCCFTLAACTMQFLLAWKIWRSQLERHVDHTGVEHDYGWLRGCLGIFLPCITYTLQGWLGMGLLAQQRGENISKDIQAGVLELAVLVH